MMLVLSAEERLPVQTFSGTKVKDLYW